MIGQEYSRIAAVLIIVFVAVNEREIFKVDGR